MNKVTRTSPVNSQYQPNLWNSIVAHPCMRADAAPSFTLGLRSYRGSHPPDPC